MAVTYIDGYIYGAYGTRGENALYNNDIVGAKVVKNTRAKLLETLNYTQSAVWEHIPVAYNFQYPDSKDLKYDLLRDGSIATGTLTKVTPKTKASDVGGIVVKSDGVVIQALATPVISIDKLPCDDNKIGYLTTTGKMVYNKQSYKDWGNSENHIIKAKKSHEITIELYSAPPYLMEVNSSPEISGEDTNLGEKNQPFEIQYSVEDKDITDNVTITEHLNNSLIRRITNANNTNQTLKITSELLNSCPLGETNTIKIYAEDEKGAGTYRNYWFKRTNTPPYFAEENTDLGTVTKAPTITFTAKDDDGDKYLKAKVKINQRVVKTYDQLGNGEQVSFTLDWKDFMQLHHSRKHNLWVEVEDSSGALATLKYTFERDTKKIEIVTNTAPLDIKIKLIVFNANLKLADDAKFEQFACNDFGTGNTWEKIQNGVPFAFENIHEGGDVIGYKCELTKGTEESEIRSIGGSFI